MFIRFLTTGGTIDKIYFDALGEYEVGESLVQHILGEGLAQFDFDVVSLFRKDSLEITAEDRQKIRSAIEDDSNSLFVVTHGTDTMVETAESLVGIAGKTIVLTGALSPARFRSTDAVFNIGLAVGAVQSLAPGVYIAMSGRVFQAGKVRKNRSRNRFEPIE